MNTLYAFFRVSDDISDDATLGSPDIRKGMLRQWRKELDAALSGKFSHPIHEAIRWAVETYGIPAQYLHDVLDGCESDLNERTIESFEDLKKYCYRVASAVGLACIRVWGLKPGCTWEAAEPLAVEAGYAFQLTNILRDLGSDARDGRVYLPSCELAEFGVDVKSWHEPANRDRMEALLAFQVKRARDYYRSSAPLSGMFTLRGKAIHELMQQAYSGLLERTAKAGVGVLAQRIRLSRWEKMKLMGGVMKAKIKLV
jgi:phytoene synthase